MMELGLKCTVGGLDAEKVVSDELTVGVHKKLAALGKRVRTRDIKTIDFRLAVSGEIERYEGKNGLNKVTIFAARGVAMIDVTFQKNVWSKGTKYFHTALLEAMQEGLLELEEKASARKLDFGGRELLEEYRKVFSLSALGAAKSQGRDAARKKVQKKFTQAKTKKKARK